MAITHPMCCQMGEVIRLKLFYMVISKTFSCVNDPQGTLFFILYGCINKIVLLCEAFVNVYLLYLIIYPFTRAPCGVQAP